MSKNGIAGQYCISSEKENYNDIGTSLDFREENDFRITTLLQRYYQIGKPTSKHNVVTTLVFGRSNNVGNTMLCQRCDSVIQRRDQNTTKIQRRYNVMCQLG